ncbi:MAG: hypothetical protein IPM55_10330 [Acidobacteria bacterium]|nr:hypothetical protein [Acidobacteriota bacterium]
MLEDLFQSDPELALYIERQRFQASMRDQSRFESLNEILPRMMQSIMPDAVSTEPEEGMAFYQLG